MTSEFLVKRIASISVSAFFFVVGFRLVLPLFAYLGLYQSIFHVIAVGLTVSIPLAFATFIFLLMEYGIGKKLEEKPYMEDAYLDAE